MIIGIVPIDSQCHRDPWIQDDDILQGHITFVYLLHQLLEITSFQQVREGLYHKQHSN